MNAARPNGNGHAPTPGCKDAELVIGISPYHLTTREAPAMAALVLASRAVTLLPAPESGSTKADVRLAVERAPRYLRLLDTWRWSSELWNGGVLSAGVAGERACDELPGVYTEIESDEEHTALRPLIRARPQRTGEKADEFLDALSHDLLRGGPDPGINIPVTAALDRFCGRHGVSVARATTSSIAQQAEAKLGRKVFSLALPVVLRGDGATILSLRAELKPALARLRSAIACALEAGANQPALTSAGGRPVMPAELGAAAEAYSRAFGEWGSLYAGHDDRHAERIVVGYVHIAGVVLPSDAALRSGRLALRAMNSGLPTTPATQGPASAPAGRLVGLVVREMNVQPE